MKNIIVVSVLCLALAGCVSNKGDPNYLAQLEAHATVERLYAQAELERAKADSEKYTALSKVGENADSQTKSMIAMAIALTGSNGGNNAATKRSAQMPPAPEAASDSLLRWVSVLSNPTVAIAQGFYNYKLGSVQSNNQAASTIAGYNTFGSIANNGFAATTNIAGAGFASNSNIAGAGFGAASRIGGLIQAPQPNITIGGNGVIGSGSYTNNPITNTNSNNRNCVGGAGAPGGNGGNGGSGSTTGGAGATGGAAGAGGQAAC